MPRNRVRGYQTLPITYMYHANFEANVVGVVQGAMGCFYDGDGWVYTIFDEPVNPFAPENDCVQWAAFELLARDHFATVQMILETN